jgi:hypothetical protein
MILKVTTSIWNTNAALSRLFDNQRLGAAKKRPGAVKKWPDIREICDARPQCRHLSAKISCRKIRQMTQAA